MPTRGKDVVPPNHLPPRPTSPETERGPSMIDGPRALQFTTSPSTSPLHHFTTSPLHRFTTSPLHRFTTSPPSVLSSATVPNLPKSTIVAIRPLFGSVFEWPATSCLLYSGK